MPLHLLGKKSWNVYNADNIARVKRDEAAEAANVEAEERRMQEISSEKRIEELRRPHYKVDEKHGRTSNILPAAGLRRRSIKPSSLRRRPGEDDTDRDLRAAREFQASREENRDIKFPSSSASLVSETGHISLFPDASSRSEERNTEAQEDETRKLQEIKEQYLVRFSDAAGFQSDPKKDPWYLKDHRSQILPSGTDISRTFDTGPKKHRLEKHPRPVATDDPLSLMRKGIDSTKRINRERRRWKRERRRDFDTSVGAKEQKSSPTT